MGHVVPGKSGEVSAEPNVVPLCDVLLVLLIIFMVVTPLVKKGVDVTLPTAFNTVNFDENLDVVLSIRKDGTMYVNEEKVTIDNLHLLLEDELMQAADKKLYLRVDQTLEYGVIVDLIETLKNAGVEDIGVLVETKTESGN